MTDSEYVKFIERSIPDYAKDKEQSDNLTEQEALDLAHKQFEELLPQGINTPKHFFFSIVDNESKQSIGDVWLADRSMKGSLYIFDLFLAPQARGKGLGKLVMSELEVETKKLSFNALRLHVFGHNTVARRLYESSGYITTNIHMLKEF